MNAMSPVEQYPQNCTFIREDWDILARHWYPVALARDLNAGPLPAVLLDQPLVIYRADGQIVVANDLCPHRGVPLSMGSFVAGTLRCAYHGLQFGAEG